MTFLSFCTLYTPQPILPLLSDEFGVQPATSALLVTLTLAPLGLAPIVYGYFLQAIPARSMLYAAVSLLIIDQLAFFAATEFWHLCVLRLVQGLLLPAIFTSLMTYCATMAAPGKVQQTMGWYVAASILGGFSGRALGGLFAEYLHWQWAFASLGLMLMPMWFMLRYLDADAEINFQRLDLRSIKRVLANPNYRNIYVVLGCCFLVFAGLLNLLPFRLHEINQAFNAAEISMFYLGYLAGIPIAILAERVLRAVGNIARALLIGVAVNAGGLFAAMSPNSAALFAAMFALAASLFFIHASLSGLANRLATEHKGVVNGLYVSVYYLSGAAGSWLSGVAYLQFGWLILTLLCMCILMGAALFVVHIRA